MYKKLLLFWGTISNLKAVQIQYQIWYRIKNNFLKLNWYKLYNSTSLLPIQSNLIREVILSNNKYNGNNKFSFLNLTHKFSNEIDWNFMQHGKLWNYNLQYFDFLFDETILLQERITLLGNFSSHLLENKVKPEPYPTSLRIINVVFFLSLYNIKNELIEKALKQQINYLECNLEYHLLANHLLENIYALFIASYTLDNDKLFRKANKMLEKQLNEQILPDGGHYECTPMYHSIILSKLFICIDVARMNKKFPANLKLMESKAALMLGWIINYSFDDYSWALINDSALKIAPSTKALISIGNKLNINSSIIPLKQSGFRKLSNQFWQAMIVAGNIQPRYQPAHTHADRLSFVLKYQGLEIITDTGVSTYSKKPLRNIERSTYSHNTVTPIDYKVSQYKLWGDFRISGNINVQIKSETSTELIAFHNGYKKQFIHQRSFALRNDNFIIADEISGINETGIAHFHFVPEIFVQVISKSEVLLYGTATLKLIIDNATNIEVEKSVVATEFNQQKENTKLKITFEKKLITTIKFN